MAEDRPWTLGRYKGKKKTKCECDLTSLILCSDLISKCRMGLKVFFKNKNPHTG